jgi:hypothetical protein
VLGFAGGWGVLAGFFIITFCAVFLALIFLDPASDDVSLDLNFGAYSFSSSRSRCVAFVLSGLVLFYFVCVCL